MNQLSLKELPYIPVADRPKVRKVLLDGILPGIAKRDDRLTKKQVLELLDNDILQTIGMQVTKVRRHKFKTSTKGAAYLVKTTTFALPKGETEAGLLKSLT